MYKRILATGVFDILHAGHVFYLSEAKKLGNKLVVLVTSDKVAKSQKRPPFFTAQERKTLIEALKMVDEVTIGQEALDYCATINSIKPDIIALGYDQKIDERKLKEILDRCGWSGQIIRLPRHPHKNHSTTNITKTIIRQLAERKEV